MKLTIIDNVISLGYQNLVEETFNSTNFDWYYQAVISAEGRDDVNTGFRHLQGCYIDHDSTEGKLRRLKSNL